MKPDAKRLRDWMTLEGRGYKAAAKSFGLSEEEVREICGAPSRARAPAHTPARAVEEEHDYPDHERPQVFVADYEPPPNPPATLPTSKDDAEADTLRWHEGKLRECEMILSACKPEAAAPLIRRAMQLKEKVDELRAKAYAKDASQLSERDALERAAEHAGRLPDPLLEQFVTEYLKRHRLKLEPA